MSGCDRNMELGAYYDGELPPARRQAMEEHLRTCAECARELERFRALSSLLTATALPGLSPAVVGRLHDAAPVVAENASDAGNLRLVKWLSAAAAVILASALLRVGFEGRQPAPAPAMADQSTLIFALNHEPDVASDRVYPRGELSMGQEILDDLSDVADKGNVSNASMNR